jgi:hypothetical protein
VYELVKTEIRKSSQKKGNHYFFVFNPGTNWHPKFDELNNANPLPQEYCGYYRDLDKLCAFLVRVLRPALGQDAFFHILIPALETLFILDPLRFPPAIGHLRLKGELDTRGKSYVCMSLYNVSEDLVLDGVENLPKSEVLPATVASTTWLGGLLGSWAGACYTAKFVLLPLVGTPPALLAYFAISSAGMVATTFAGISLGKSLEVKPRVLGAHLLN